MYSSAMRGCDAPTATPGPLQKRRESGIGSRESGEDKLEGTKQAGKQNKRSADPFCESAGFSGAADLKAQRWYKLTPFL